MEQLKNKAKEKLKDRHAVVAASAYLVFFLPRFTGYNADPDIHFHMKQGMGLLTTALSLQGIISVFGYWGMPAWRVWPVRLILLYLLYVGIGNALAHRKNVLPWIGEIADRAFRV